ncbi:MAG: TetR/AcrR family transcriptional regulator [Ktedonobacterales bacterium]
MSRRTDPDERERKWRHILEVAAGEFARLGFDGANINAISTRAGLGKGTIYLYAASKEQLFLDVLHEIGRLTRTALDDSLTDSVGAPVPQRLRAIAEAFSELAAQHPDFVRLQASTLFGVNRRFQTEMAQVLRESVMALTDGFAQEQDRGAMRRVHPESLAVLLLGVLQTFALLPEALELGVETPSVRVELLVDTLWQGLQPIEAPVARRG